MRAVTIGVLLAAVIGSGCARAYYGAWERLGKDKRDLLVDRVEDARAVASLEAETGAIAIHPRGQRVHRGDGGVRSRI